MNFESTDERAMIRSTAESVAAEYGPEYWREKEENGEFAQRFWDELSEAGFHGLLVPEEYDGAGMGMQEMGLTMETLCAEGCGMAGTWYLVLTAGMAAVGIPRERDRGPEGDLPSRHRERRAELLHRNHRTRGGDEHAKRRNARREGRRRVRPQRAEGVDHVLGPSGNMMIIVTRTTPLAEVDRGTDGISLFIVDMDDPGIDVSPIPKHGINYSKSCEVFLEDVRVPEENLAGEEDEGWWALVDMLNPERIGFAAAGTGIGKLAAETAVKYANDREVFGTPIGSHQAVSFPITQAYARMETAALMREKAAWLYDHGEDCGYETNVAKATAVSAGIEAVKQSMQAFGGWGYAKEYDVERWWREINLTRLAPVSQQMAYNHISQQLGFPKSY